MASKSGTPSSEALLKSPRIREAARWYDDNIALHKRLATKVEQLLIDILSGEKLPYASISFRVKDRESFLKKASKRKYSDPTSQIKDVVGLRVTTYFESMATKACEFIKREFTIDSQHSLDKSEALGTDKVGYRSVHFIGRLSPERTKLPEYRTLADPCFEIQVRSILQHAWAEIEHDRRFKFQGELPAAIKRRFSVLAGVLELADREFDSIAEEIDRFLVKTAAAAQASSSSEPLTLENLILYLNANFSEAIESNALAPNFGTMNRSSQAVEELQNFGIDTLGKLAELIPEDFVSQAPWAFSPPSTFLGLIRDAMLVKDAGRYFEKSWQRDWLDLDKTTAEALTEQGVDIDGLHWRFQFRISEDDDDFAYDDMER